MDQNEIVTEAEMLEGLFLLCGARLEPEGFKQFANIGSDAADSGIRGDGIRKEHFRRVITCLFSFVIRHLLYAN